MTAFINYVLYGPDADLTMPADWLANKARLVEYTDWTQRQCLSRVVSRAIVSNAVEIRRREFWARQGKT